MAIASASSVSSLSSTYSHRPAIPSKSCLTSPPRSLSLRAYSEEPLQRSDSSNQEDRSRCLLAGAQVTRRSYLLAGAALMPFVFTKPPRLDAREVEVGSFLPPSPSNPSFVVFKATSKDTPHFALVSNVEPYEFMLPPSWKQTRVANILSGKLLPTQVSGKIQVVASPLVRLTNKPNATIEDIGSPEKVIASLGAFVTGNTFDSDELLETSIEKRGDLTYYTYALETPYALTGTHNLAKATAKGNTLVLFVVSASDKQWPSSQSTLRTILDSFQL
ncbi:unnamed protein product [Spirodela intermedia]|uniref:PsbP C-terminal domain-containing protein n=1 Tax=Spirodela intermedia TaxID=51605 RepID=A0A7I8IWD3_SPIIN|nr:unnamed protein product [Spirodela intermedia]CAA6661973.1 unnamed protein product [Spirodela intermedia]